MAYVHPILGALVVGLTLWVASQGMRARHRAPYAKQARKSHGTVSPWVMVLCWLALLAGLASTAWVREDLSPASTLHGAVGACLALGMVGSWRLSGRFRDPAARTWHFRLGLAITAAALAVAVLGMRLLP